MSYGEVLRNKNRKKQQVGKILGTPIRYLPNCAEFEIELKEMEPLADLFGLKRKLKPQIEITPYKNYGMNKYLESQVERLLKYSRARFSPPNP
jgi:hypothetical protein